MIYPEHDPALPVVVFDFDGVLAKNTWPSPAIGAVDWEAIDAISHYHEQGCEVVICTARPESHFPRIWAWLKQHGIDWAVYELTNRKPKACLYFDDRAVVWPLPKEKFSVLSAYLADRKETAGV